MNIENEKQGNAIIFLLNRNYIFALAEFLINIHKTNPNLFDCVVVYQPDFTEDDINNLLKIEKKMKFVKATLEIFEEEHGKIVGEKGLKYINRYSHMLLFRYRVLEQLEYFDKILCLDLDMLLLDDISELFEIKGIAWRNTVTDFEEKFDILCGLDKLRKFTDADVSNWKTPNGGMVYINGDGIDWRKCLESGKEFTIAFMNDLDAGIDEMVFSWMAYQNNLSVTSLDKTVYNATPINVTYDTKIVHFMNKCKVWNNCQLQTIFPQWKENYLECKKILDIDNSAVVFHDKCCTREFMFEALWNELFLKKGLVIPMELRQTVNFSRKKIRYFYSQDIFYELEAGVMKREVGIKFVVKSAHLLETDGFMDEIRLIPDKYTLTWEENELTLQRKRVSIEKAKKEFSTFLDETFHMIKKYYKTEICCDRIVYNKKHIVADPLKISEFNVAWEYFKYLMNDDRYLCLISCKGNCLNRLTAFYSYLGVELEKTPSKDKGYILIINAGKVLIAQRAVEKETLICKGFVDVTEFDRISGTKKTVTLFIYVESEGNKGGMEKSRIMVDNTDYSLNRQGLNAVLIDKETASVVDSINIKMDSEELVIMR